MTLPYNLVDSTYEYTWNELDQNWNIRQKMFIENDCVIGRPSVVLIQVDSSGNGIFSNETKIQYQYFDTDNLQKTEYFRWNPAQQTWEQFLLTSYVRPNEPLEELIRFWDEASNTLIGGMRTAYSYDNNDKLERSENYDLDIPTNSWVLGSRRTYTYTNGLNTKILEEIYQPASNSWLPSERITNTYDDNGHLLTHTIEYDYGNGLIAEYKDTFTYNASGQLIEKIQQYYTGFALENYFKETYQYYDNGVTAFTDRHLWLPNQQDWLWNGQMALREDGRLNFLWSKYFTSDTSSQLDGGFQTRRFYTSEGLYDYTLMEKFVPQGPEEWVPSTGSPSPTTMTTAFWKKCTKTGTKPRWPLSMISAIIISTLAASSVQRRI
ncbi:MAG: hypothetical protein IPN76_32500 [Saprospiraceae bacterium]|nr:hypothetical protein [Saprospiraceae bacterium]